MKITNKILAQRLIGYLHHSITLTELVDWAERSMMEADFEEKQFETIREIVSRLGLADVRAFGLSWEECESFLTKLGYQVNIEVMEKQASA